MYIGAEINKYIESLNYQYYMSDIGKGILEGLARFSGNKNVDIDRFYDLMNRPVITDNRTGDEIVNDVFGKIGIKVIDDECNGNGGEAEP